LSEQTTSVTPVHCAPSALKSHV